MSTARLVIDRDFRIGLVNRRVFGSFVEHMGRCVYTGIYEPGHPEADGDGFRRDVTTLVRELGVTTVRYPGGNFVSGYRWEDGVGPRADRPVRLDLAWRSTETNEFGLGEFIDWTRQAGVEPMLAVNLGTRGVQEAVDLLEYCNHPGGTALSDLRAQHGYSDPYGVRMWCLGNEMDGPWQIGHKTADEYGRLAQETGKAMKLLDPSIELVACGSSGGNMPTFGEWEATVLGRCYDEVDHISLHAYYGLLDAEGRPDLASFLASGADMDSFIQGVIATADYVRAKRRASKRMMLSFDEWNVWHTGTFEGGAWERAPRLSEDEFGAADAVVAGGLLISLLKHADRVTAACQAQLVNLLGMIRTEPGGPAWRQTIFYPFAQAAAYASGEALRLSITSPRHETARYGDVPVIDAVATRDEEARTLTLFAVNRHPIEETDLTVDLRGFAGTVPVEHLVLAAPDPSSANTLDHPDRVTPHTRGLAPATGLLVIRLPAASWNVIRLADRGTLV
jgi:alpha-N-arabinofuranosidase